MKKMSELGIELDATALQHVQGGGFVIAGPGDTHFPQLSQKQLEQIGKAVVDAGKIAYQVGKTVWNAITSWF